MNRSFIDTKTKIAVHTFGFLGFCCVLLSLAIPFSGSLVGLYLLVGTITGEAIRILFSRRKYLLSIDQTDSAVSVKYCNRMLLPKSVVIDFENLASTYTSETNKWLGRLDLVRFSNVTQDLTFDLIDEKTTKLVLQKLELGWPQPQ